MRKLTAIFIIMLVVLSFVSAKLVIWSSENQIPALQKLAADFESDYGIQVEIQQVNFGDIKSKFLTAAPWPSTVLSIRFPSFPSEMSIMRLLWMLSITAGNFTEFHIRSKL